MNREKMISYIKENIKKTPRIGIVLGSGLGDVAECVENPTYISYNDIPDFPVSTVAGHTGRFLFGEIDNISVVIMQGRVHYYEGYTMSQVVLPIQIMGKLGIDTLILTNAAGGITDKANPGDIMIIKDHISSFIQSPLIGTNDESLGERFPDMTHVYDKEYIDIMKNAYMANQIEPKEGVYIQVTGPQYETPAEIMMYKMCGADAVGMSTVCEAIAARHMGIRTIGLSTICNKAAGIGGELSHSEIISTGREMSEKLINIILFFIKEYRRRFL